MWEDGKSKREVIAKRPKCTHTLEGPSLSSPRLEGVSFLLPSEIDKKRESRSFRENPLQKYVPNSSNRFQPVFFSQTRTKTEVVSVRSEYRSLPGEGTRLPGSKGDTRLATVTPKVVSWKRHGL